MISMSSKPHHGLRLDPNPHLMAQSIQSIGHMMESIWQFAKDGMAEEPQFVCMLQALGPKSGVNQSQRPACLQISLRMGDK